MFYLRESEAAAKKRPVGTEINPRFAEEPYYGTITSLTQ
jgi:hypothetical protein